MYLEIGLRINSTKRKMNTFKHIERGIVIPLFIFFNFCVVFYHAQEKEESDKNILFYEIKTNYSIIKSKVLRLEMFSYDSFNNNQKLISYDFCMNLNECDRNYEIIENGKRKISHYSMTGYIKTNDSFWLHPPRSDNFRVLELNAFPYYEKGKENWNYTLNFGDHWSDKNWIEWKGNRTSISNYKLEKKIVNYKLGNKKIKCFKIRAVTVINNLGITFSTFYYNDEYGFLRMIFKTINKKKIEFNLMYAK